MENSDENLRTRAIDKLRRLLNWKNDHPAILNMDLSLDNPYDNPELDEKEQDIKIEKNDKKIKRIPNKPFRRKLFRKNSKEDKIHCDNPFLPGVPFQMLIVGLVRAGKSTFMRNLFEFYKDVFDVVFFISPTHNLDPEAIQFKDDHPQIQCFKSLAMLEKIIPKMERTNRMQIPKDKLHALIIMDDCIADILRFSRRDGNIVNRLCFNRRHIALSTIIMTQYWVKIPPFMRTNCDAYVLFRQENEKERKKIVEELSGFLGKENFQDVFSHATYEPYSALTINFDCQDNRFMYTKNFDTLLNL